MISSSIPKRYARALLARARELSLNAESLAGELASMADLLKPGTALQGLLANKLIPAERKTEILESILVKAAPAPLLADFLRLLLRKDRLLLLPEISLAFRALADDLEGILRGEVLGATGLPDKTTASLKEALTKSMSKKVILTLRTDPEIIGGLIVRVGSLSFNGSIRSRMDSIRKKLGERVNP